MKEIDIHESLKEVMNGNEYVFYTYNDAVKRNFRWFSPSFDHVIRNPERYKFFIDEPKETLWERGIIQSTYEETCIFKLNDVKEAINSFLQYCFADYKPGNMSINDKAIEIFGEEMLK
jgi:hypothetical protein